jgi:predicted transcriptional regulator
LYGSYRSGKWLEEVFEADDAERIQQAYDTVVETREPHTWRMNANRRLAFWALDRLPACVLCHILCTKSTHSTASRFAMNRPQTQAISFRIRSEKVDELERLAEATDRPRSWHIEQALDAYLDVQSWQIAQIEKSMAEMDAGKGIPHEEIKKELGNWGKGGKTKRAK